MRLNLINFLHTLETTTVERILGKMSKGNGRCALGLCADDMVALDPARWCWRDVGDFPVVKDQQNMASNMDTIASYLGLAWKDVWDIAMRNDEGMTFKGNAKFIRDNILTDEERALLNKMEQENKEVESKCLTSISG